MKHFRKSIISVLLAVMLIFSTLTSAVTAFAADDEINVSLCGNFNDWIVGADAMVKEEINKYVVSVDLPKGEYEFKIVQDGLWYGSNKTLSNATAGLEMSISYNNCKLKATGGTYKFIYNPYSHTLSIEATVLSEETSYSDVYLSGDFNNWSINGNAMKTTDDITYTITLEFERGTYYFNIINKGLWYGDSIVFNDSTKNYSLKMSGGACTLVATGGTYEFSFNTEKNTLTLTQTIAKNDPANVSHVYLAGDFNNWSSTANVMTKESATSVTNKITLYPGIYKFKIVCDGLWYGSDTTILNSTSEAGVVLYSDKGDCTIETKGGSYTFHFDISTKTVKIDYQETSVDAASLTTVSIAGDFNNWSKTANKMDRASNSTVSTSIELKAGTYNFKIVQDDLWFGSNNTLPNTATDFQLSALEGNCTLKTLGGTYTFIYNVVNNKLTTLYTPSDEDPAETANVSIAGTFNNWSKTSNKLTYSKAETVQTTMELSGGTHNFKIVHDDLWYGNNNVIADTTTTTSADGVKLSITNGNCTLVASGGKYTFIYNVITNNLIVEFEGTVSDPADNANVSLAGSFNDWSKTANVLKKKSANIVSTTVELPMGQYYFKMVRGDLWYGNANEINDRTNKVSMNGLQMSAVAPECKLNATGGKYTFEYDVINNTLIVDCELAESQENASVFLAGDFNDWSTTANPLTATSSYLSSTQLTLKAGTYKFKIVSNGLWYGTNSIIFDSTSYMGTVTSMYSGDCTLEAQGGVYTFQFNSISKALTITYRQTGLADISTVSLAGDFNDWDTESTVMKATTHSNIVSTTINLKKGQYYFNVIRDSQWYGTDTDECFVAHPNYGYSAELTKTKNPCVLLANEGTYYFYYYLETNQLSISYSPASYDESDYAVINLAGDFNDWSTTADTLTKSKDQTVSITKKLSAGTYKFKIVHNNNWYGNDGTIKDTTSGANWELSASAGDITLEATGGYYLFNYNAVKKTLEITSIVTDEDPADSVKLYLAGDFNGWGAAATRMEKFDGTKVVACVTLDKGVHHFKLTDTYNFYGAEADDEIFNTTSHLPVSTTGSDFIIHSYGGEYYFTYDILAKTLEVNHLAR